MKIQQMDIEKIQPYDRNVKKHDPEQVARIAKSIKDLGWDQPIVVDGDGVIIKGHGRRLAAISLGLTKVPVLVRTDLTPEQVRAARLVDNRVALSGIDTALLAIELTDINKELLVGMYDEKELDFMTADLGKMNTDAFIPDVGDAVREQEELARQKATESAEKRVSLTKAFGFKDIKAAHQLIVSRFMARVEAESGKAGEEALIHFFASCVPA